MTPAALRKLAEARGHWRQLPGQKGHDELGGETHGRTWVREGRREGFALKPHQIPAKAVFEASPNKGMILGMGTGTGKTPTGIDITESLLDSGRAKRVLVVLPKALDANFIDSGIKRFTTSSVEEGLDPKKVGKSTYVVVGLERFRKDPEAWVDAVKPDVLLADELHRSVNTDTASYKAMLDARQRVPYFLGLTASLAGNNPSDIVPLLDLARGERNSLGGREGFQQRFTKKVRSYPGGLYGGMVTERTLTRADELREKLKPWLYYVGTDQVAEMPPTEEQTVQVPMSKEQKKMLDTALSGVDPSVRRSIADLIIPGSAKGTMNILTSIQKARAVSSSVRAGDPSLDLVEAVRRSPKLARVIDDATQHIKDTPDGRVVMFTNQVKNGMEELAAALKDRGITFSVFTAKDDDRWGDRKQNVKDFLAGKSQVMLVTPAGVEGLNLNNATMFQLVDEHYNPEKNRQAIARAVRADSLEHRPKGERVVKVRRYQSVYPRGFLDRITGAPVKGSVDQWVHQLQGRKERLNAEFRDVLAGTYEERQDEARPSLFQRLFGG